MQEEFLRLFGVSEQQLQKLISIALSEGGEYADLFFEEITINELSLRDNKVNIAGSQIDFGVGIRVINGEKTGYAYSEQTNMAEMTKAAKFAAKIATSPDKTISPAAAVQLKGHNFYPQKRTLESISIEEKLPYLELLNSKIFSTDSCCKKVIAALSDSTTKVLFYNSLGESYTDTRPLVSLMANIVMEKDGRRESASLTRSHRAGFEIITESLIEEMAAEIVAKGAFLFNASQPTGGQMDVVMAAGSSGILLHEAVGHAFEADFIRKGISIFSGKLGQKVCHHSINIVDDATIVANRGALNYDDEGVLGQKTYLVKEGILNSYLHDRISARYYKTAPTGNGRRESFRYAPIPRMRATYMENGECSEEQIIKSVKHGIYANDFSNGQVQIGAGDFTFFVKSGYLIENGKLTRPIKDVNIIGNGPKALADIEMVANNNIIDNSRWTCGKGQYCPVSCGMPSVLVKNLIVGGAI